MRYLSCLVSLWLCPASGFSQSPESTSPKIEVPAPAKVESPPPSQAENLGKAPATPTKPKPDVPTLNWSGQLQADNYWFTQDDASRATYGLIPNGAGFRRARIGMFGEYGSTDYRIEVDFAQSGRPTFLDVFAGVKDLPILGSVRAGHFFEPYSLGRLTSNRFAMFMERNLFDQAFVPARNLGIAFADEFLNERVTTAFGVFRADSNNFGDDTGNRFESAITGRVTGLPVYEDNGKVLVHTGLGYSFRGPNQGVVQFRAQPEARIGATTPNVPFLVDTGRIPTKNYHLIGPEIAGVYGPLSVQAEATLVPVNTTRAGSLFFYGWYVEAGYFLTGEYRPYIKNNGTFDRVIPLRDAISSNKTGGLNGPGAVQLAVRVSQLDLNDGSVAGGRLTDFTAGVNWHLNPYLRVTANYILAITDQSPRGNTRTNGFGMRVGFDF